MLPFDIDVRTETHWRGKERFELSLLWREISLDTRGGRRRKPEMDYRGLQVPVPFQWGDQRFESHLLQRRVSGELRSEL
jgi:hypothetical protein